MLQQLSILLGIIYCNMAYYIWFLYLEYYYFLKYCTNTPNQNTEAFSRTVLEHFLLCDTMTETLVDICRAEILSK